MKTLLSLLLLVIGLQNVRRPLCTFVLYWPSSLSFQSTHAPARRSHNGSVILQADTICWLIWAPHAKGKQQAKDGVAVFLEWLVTTKGTLDYYRAMGVGRTKPRWRAPLTLSCLTTQKDPTQAGPPKAQIHQKWRFSQGTVSRWDACWGQRVNGMSSKRRKL